MLSSNCISWLNLLEKLSLGHMDGRGEKKFDDGREYTGHFKLNNLDGVGEMRWPDGRSFRGTFKNNREEKSS